MDFGLIKRTLNVDNILSVLTEDVIFDAISEDGFTKDQLKPNVFDEYWLEIKIKNELVGIVQLKPMFSKCWDAHIHVLPEHRGHSKAIGYEVLEWCSDNISGVLYTTVPVIYNNVVRFLESFDFEHSGIIKGAWTKNKEHHDLMILTRIL